jgi:hypothetical protein
VPGPGDGKGNFRSDRPSDTSLDSVPVLATNATLRGHKENSRHNEIAQASLALMGFFVGRVTRDGSIKSSMHPNTKAYTHLHQ